MSISRTFPQKRDYSIDVISGVFICNMILGHCILMSGTFYLPFTKNLNYLYFFMPWFFFKSGQFFHCKTQKIIIKESYRRLLLPFFIFSIIGHFFEILNIALSKNICYQISNLLPIKSLIIQGAIPANLPLWYLLSLFFVRTIGNIIIKTTSNKQTIGVIALIFICIALLLFFNNVRYPLYLSNICTGLFFFLMGYIFKEIQFHLFFFIISFCGYLCFCIFGLTIVDMRLNKLLHGFYLLFPIASIMGIVFINNIIKRLNIRCRPLEFIGKNSMDFYVLHWIIITVVFIIINTLEIDISRKKLLISFIGANATIIPALIFTFHKNKYYRKAMGYST